MNIDPEALIETPEELYESAPCGYLLTLPDGTIIRANQTCLTWIGMERHDLVGHKRVQDLLSIGGRVFYDTHFAPLLRMQGFVNEVAFDLICADGRPCRFSPMLSRSGTLAASDRQPHHPLQCH